MMSKEKHGEAVSINKGNTTRAPKMALLPEGQTCFSKFSGRKTIRFFGFAVLAAAIVFGFAACSDGGGGGGGDITYTPTANNITDTTAINFTFNSAVTGLTASDISVTDGTGSVTKGGAVTGSGTSWSLPVTVIATGNISVSITKTGIESASKTVAVYKGGGGETWTAVTDSTFGSIYINSVAYGDGKWVAGGHNDKMAYSDDGETWTAVTSTFDNYNIYGVAYGGGRWVAGGQGGKMAYSDDGETWTPVTNSPFVYNINGVAYGGGRWVAVGQAGNMAYSTNGETWTRISATNSTFDTSEIRGVAYGGATGSEKFVAVGNAGKMAYSADGITWTAVTNSTFGSSYIESVAYGNGRWVAGGWSGKMAYSADGITWTAVADSAFGTYPNFILSVAYGGGRWVAGGWGGKMAYWDE